MLPNKFYVVILRLHNHQIHFRCANSEGKTIQTGLTSLIYYANSIINLKNVPKPMTRLFSSENLQRQQGIMEKKSFVIFFFTLIEEATLFFVSLQA
jgi:hypothetical protein